MADISRGTLLLSVHVRSSPQKERESRRGGKHMPHVQAYLQLTQLAKDMEEDATGPLEAWAVEEVVLVTSFGSSSLFCRGIRTSTMRLVPGSGDRNAFQLRATGRRDLRRRMSNRT